MKRYLLDSGFLYALINKKEKRFSDVAKVSENVDGQILLPTVAITEVAYLVDRDLGTVALAQFIDLISNNQFVLAHPTTEDLKRAAEVVCQYADSKIDFVDAVLVAIAERENITDILTIDTRHFRLFRPTHCDAFTLFP